jgi:peptidyl-prolyl cis-trans isomerase A (cyclophilin A)
MTKTGRLFALTAAAALLNACAPAADEMEETMAPPVPNPELLTPTDALVNAAAPDSFTVLFETSKGNFTVLARRAWAPRGVDRFHYLVSHGYYDDVRFFRVIPGFVAQFGISGFPEVAMVWRERGIQDDPVIMGNTKGRITYAMGGPNSRTTQLFINLADNSRLDADGFAAFGDVVEGMSVVESFYGGYGNDGVSQGLFQEQGNIYVTTNFPELDFIKSARIVP